MNQMLFSFDLDAEPEQAKIKTINKLDGNNGVLLLRWELELIEGFAKNKE
jgi:hypothetical protein